MTGRASRLGDVRVVVPQETVPGERRVATVPDMVARLAAAGCSVGVQAGAGLEAFVSDDDLAARGADIVTSREQMLRGADVVLSVQPLSPADVALLQTQATTLSFLQPWAHGD